MESSANRSLGEPAISAAEINPSHCGTGFCAYFTYFLWFAIAHGQFLSVPFLLMFKAASFMSVSLIRESLA